MGYGEYSEREYLEGLRYEDKFPDNDTVECPHCMADIPRLARPAITEAQVREKVVTALNDGFALSDLDHFGVTIEARDEFIELVADGIVMALVEGAGNEQ